LHNRLRRRLRRRLMPLLLSSNTLVLKSRVAFAAYPLQRQTGGFYP